MTATTTCAHCGITMPAPTGRASRRRYCGDRCRRDAWLTRRYGRQFDTDIVHDDVTDVVLVPTTYDAVATPGGQHRCPHCHQPLAVISVIVPAAAAHIPTPEVMHMNPT
jgi:endogenous inhibitor of DNA gyrase (YacG/DUF329 family)